MSPPAALPKAVALAVPLTLGAWTVQAAEIIQTAEQDGRFTGFLHLLEAAGMIEVLEGEGPLPFPPVDEAFGQLPPGVLEWLLAEETGKALEAVIQSHIVPGAALLAEDLLNREVELKRWAVLGSRSVAPPGSSWWSHSRPPLRTIKRETKPNIEAIPASAIVVGTPQDAVAGAELSMVPTGQELTAVAMVVELISKPDNGVIHGIDLVLLSPEALRSF